MRLALNAKKRGQLSPRRAFQITAVVDRRHSSGLLGLLAFAGTVILFGAVKGGFHRAELFARLEGLVVFLLALDLFRRVVGGLDGETDAALRLVDLDDAGGDVYKRQGSASGLTCE